ncbi:sugar ABC transporter permease [Phototrophicus methaneseepsis]|uniref:Sugar ABC transporter permease n=1 Tax=Phototrophicus methaneseepsis TaxID=2710758 RepID=A0A7S8EAH7_9CHLR|nr:sugar ABC transporter permease [Phototrophicus methaneseepsis]QPC83357.1 sugar ABC transporter permease [Phototrophicus methaneseepsis]
MQNVAVLERHEDPQPQTEDRRHLATIRRLLPTPTIVFMIIVTQLPLLVTLAYSLERWNLLRPDRRAFQGLSNYSKIITDPEFWTIIRNTLVLTISVVILTLVAGMILALLLNRNFIGRGIVRTLLITPFLLMPTVSAVLWKNVLFNPAFGLLAALFALLGLPRPDLLAEHPMISVIVIVVWQWTPFMMLILLAGLQSLAQDQVEAAQIDGGSPLAIFRHIVLPHLQRYIELAVLMETLFILSVFGVIFVTTSGGPGIQTTNLSYGIYQEAFQRWDIGGASALGVYAIILANIVMMLFVRVLRRGQNNGGSSA